MEAFARKSGSSASHFMAQEATSCIHSVIRTSLRFGGRVETIRCISSVIGRDSGSVEEFQMDVSLFTLAKIYIEAARVELSALIMHVLQVVLTSNALIWKYGALNEKPIYKKHPI